MDNRETEDFEQGGDESERPTIEDTSPSSGFGAFADPKQIGPFKILAKLGEGGFGVVYEAKQESPIKRRVALKVIKPGMDSNAVVARFEAERQALALMSHPSIAKVLDGGITDLGLPYFVMELVKGEPITSFCDRNKLALTDRVKLLIPVCQAIQHAHSKSVIHRDLKPSNILVGYNSEGHPHPTVIDFGIAKALNQQLTEKTIYTTQGQMIGTPEYMSPEQAEMSGLDIDTRTDVYSLGVVLYELLTGMLPVEPSELRSKMYREMQRMIREFVPPKPSTRLGSALSTMQTRDSAKSAATSRRMTDSELSKTLVGELDWIVMKCLEKDRDRRYATPTALAEELGHYLNNEPINARPPSTRYVIGKLIKRNKAVFAGVGIIAATLVGATVVSMRYSVIANTQRVKAQNALTERDAALVETQEALRVTEQQLEQIQSLVRVYSDYEEQIRRIEGATTARSRLANATITVLDQLSSVMGSQAWIKHELAEGYLTVGQIHGIQNDHYEEVVDAFTRARKLFAELAQENPTDPRVALGEAQALIGLVMSQIGNADVKRLKDLAARAEEISRTVPVEEGLASLQSRVLARSLLAQAELAMADQHLSESAELAQRVIDQYAQLDESQLGDVKSLDVAADANRARARALRELGDLDGAIAGYESGIELRRRGVNLFPTDSVLRRGLIHDLHWLGRVNAYDKNDPERAVDIYRQSLAHAEHLREADPEDGLAYELVLDQRKSLATALRRSGNLEQAQEQTRLLILAAEDFVDRDPLNRLRQRRLFAIHFDEARVQYDEALQRLRDPATQAEGMALLRKSVESFDRCSNFYRGILDQDPMGSYDKFNLDAAEVELQHAKAIETLGNESEDAALIRTAMDSYQRAADLYVLHSKESELASDQLRNLSIAYRNIGTIALSIPDGKTAVKYLERADTVLPLDRWDAFARKAEAYRLIGDADRCKDYAQQAMDATDKFDEPKRSNARARVQAILDALASP
tara:strand:+ start:140407 stop:143364 length:2958 start_codon:yes stop_codon:yes gene_type:complete